MTSQIIKDAIRAKKSLTAMYRGHYREMCPHVLGLNKKSELNVLVVQFGGSSRRGLSHEPSRNWRCMKVAALEDVALRDGEWHTAPNYDPETQLCVASIQDWV